MDYHRVCQLSVNNLWHTIKPSPPIGPWGGSGETVHDQSWHHPLVWNTYRKREAAGTLKDNGNPSGSIHLHTSTPVLRDQGNRQRPKHHLDFDQQQQSTETIKQFLTTLNVIMVFALSICHKVMTIGHWSWESFVRCSCPCICPRRACNCNWSLFEPSKSELADFQL